VRSEKYQARGYLAVHFSLPEYDFLQNAQTMRPSGAFPVRRGWLGHPYDRRDELHPPTIRVRCPLRERLGRPCWQSRAVSLLTSRQNPGVPFESQTR
jgi:hypothetical protein